MALDWSPRPTRPIENYSLAGQCFRHAWYFQIMKAQSFGMDPKLGIWRDLYEALSIGANECEKGFATWSAEGKYEMDRANDASGIARELIAPVADLWIELRFSVRATYYYLVDNPGTWKSIEDLVRNSFRENPEAAVAAYNAFDAESQAFWAAR